MVYRKDRALPLELFWHICQNSTDHKCKDLSQVLNSVPFITVPIFAPSPPGRDYYSIRMSFEIRKCEASNFILFQKIHLCNPDSTCYLNKKCYLFSTCLRVSLLMLCF
jgi:hypothetical protein